jgi:hypothetical protein
MQHRLLFRVGCAAWIAGGTGHFVLVDALTLHGRTRVSEFVPRADILDVIGATTLTFGSLGSTTAFLAMTGFSLWVALSLVLLGVTYWVVSQQETVTLRPFTRLGVIVSATFTAIAAACFIYPAIIGGLLATALFVASWIARED